MNENNLIPVKFNNDIPKVSGRELYKSLGVDTPYRIWFPRMCEYGFTEGEDYTPYIFVHPQNRQEITDHDLTIPMAKEIAMLQRNEKGKVVRRYLIAVEEAWNTPDMIMARALKLMDSKMKLLEADKTALNAQIQADAPKVAFADAVTEQFPSPLNSSCPVECCEIHSPRLTGSASTVGALSNISIT